jgi:hypothetical protein
MDALSQNRTESQRISALVCVSKKSLRLAFSLPLGANPADWCKAALSENISRVVRTAE